MTRYEKLVVKAEKENINVLEMDLGTNKKCGKYFYTKRGKFIFINSNIADTEKYEVLSEELGHHYTSSGDILKQTNINDIKQEKIARRYGYELIIGISDLVCAFKTGARNRYEIAQYLDVTEEFLQDAINYYKEKYGLYYIVDGYCIYFSPNLGIALNDDARWHYKP